MWVPPEIKEPIILHHPGKTKVGYFGAVRIKDGKFIYIREEEIFNAETFFTFMKYLRQISCHSKNKTIVITDNVRYHHARLHSEWREASKKNFSLLFMPPYSPELNPIERVWKLTRRKAIHNKYFANINEVTSAVENIFEQWKYPNETLRSLCAIT
jgi:transposase